jgi:hypothetical protein
MFGRTGSHGSYVGRTFRSGNTVRHGVRRAVGFLAIASLWAVPTLAQHVDPHAALDLDGRAVDPLLASPPVRATVLIFTRTDCPIANRYAPAIERLRSRFEPAGVRFWLVFVDPTQPAAAVREHMSAYGVHARPLRDPSHALLKLTGATVTPEAAVYVPIDGRPRLVYRGRIDDRYVDVAHRRPQPTTDDLQQALDDALRGAPAGAPRITQPIGCIIADLK